MKGKRGERFRLNFLLYLLTMVMMLLKKYKKNLKVWCSKSSCIYYSIYVHFSLHLNIFSLSFCQCNAVMGNCLFAYGRKLGELCRRDADCESGLICDLSAVSGASVCRAPMAVAKQYAEDCLTSSDCDITRYVHSGCCHFYFLFANGAYVVPTSKWKLLIHFNLIEIFVFFSSNFSADYAVSSSADIVKHHAR